MQYASCSLFYSINYPSWLFFELKFKQKTIKWNLLSIPSLEIIFSWQQNTFYYVLAYSLQNSRRAIQKAMRKINNSYAYAGLNRSLNGCFWGSNHCYSILCILQSTTKNHFCVMQAIDDGKSNFRKMKRINKEILSMCITMYYESNSGDNCFCYIINSNQKKL